MCAFISIASIPRNEITGSEAIHIKNFTFQKKLGQLIFPTFVYESVYICYLRHYLKCNSQISPN